MGQKITWEVIDGKGEEEIQKNETAEANDCR